MAEAINPEYNPTGIEGGVDVNVLPWMAVPGAAGTHLKPLRASTESGMFSVAVKLDAGAGLRSASPLGGMDLLVLSGAVLYDEGGIQSTLEPGTWGYLPANTRIDSMVGEGDAELLVNFYSALAFQSSDGSVSSVLTSADVRRLAGQHGITLVPNTLADCMQDRPDPFTGDGEPLAIASRDASQLVVGVKEQSNGDSGLRHDHFIDTRDVPWVVNPDLPDIGLKILRVSAETGVVSLVVRHNGVADPHNHLGASDFLVLSGRIGYRAGPTGRIRAGRVVLRTRRRPPRCDPAADGRRPHLHGECLRPADLRLRPGNADRGRAVLDGVRRASKAAAGA